MTILYSLLYAHKITPTQAKLMPSTIDKIGINISRINKIPDCPSHVQDIEGIAQWLRVIKTLEKERVTKKEQTIEYRVTEIHGSIPSLVRSLMSYKGISISQKEKDILLGWQTTSKKVVDTLLQDIRDHAQYNKLDKYVLICTRLMQLLEIHDKEIEERLEKEEV